MLSHHAQRRMQTRGVRPGFVESILDHADREILVGGQCALLRISRTKARALNIDDRIGRYAVIWSEATSTVVTVLPIHPGPSGARYRRSR